MNITIIIQQVLVLAILMLIGYVSGKLKVFSYKDSLTMTKILTNIAMPALVISAFSLTYTDEIKNDLLIILGFAFIAHLVAAILGKIAFYKFSKDKKAVLVFGNTFSNAGFMGLPFIYAVFGDQSLLYGSLYMISFHILIWTFGENLMKDNNNKFDIESFISNPSIIAIIIGSFIFISRTNLPNFINQPISMLSAITSPLAMLILGINISSFKLKEIMFDLQIYYTSFIKLIITPLLMIFILNFIQINPMIKNVLIIMQSLPVAILTVVLSQKHDLDDSFASKVVVLSHALLVITITFVSLFL